MNPRDESRLSGVLRAIAGSLVALLQSHLELFALEAQEEKKRLLRLVFRISAAVLLGATSFLFLNFALVYITPEQWRWLVLLGLGLLYLLLFLIIVMQLRRQVRHAGMPFPQTINELKKDGECLRKDR